MIIGERKNTTSPIAEKMARRVIAEANQLGILNFLMEKEVSSVARGFPIRNITAEISRYQTISLKYQTRNPISATLTAMMIYFASLFILYY
jgi:hypothetical protein